MFDIGTFDALTFDAGNVSGSVTPPDTHDGVFDADLYRKLQKKLKRRQTIEEEVERAKALRSTIESVIRNDDVPEPVRQEALAVLAKPAQDSLPDYGPLAADLLALNLQLQSAQRALLEYAAFEQDEEDIELLLGSL